MASWVTVDTRKLGSVDDRRLDGFVHVVPRETSALHVIAIQCWCDPRLVWPEDGSTFIVSHKDKRSVQGGWRHRE